MIDRFTMIAALAGLGLSTGPVSSSVDNNYAVQLLSAKNLVPVAQNRRLNFFCIGRGSPVVIFEQGTGGNVLDWKKVAVPISRHARVCLYDRAGYGFSDPAGRPSTAINITDDLHAAINHERIKKPIVLVGHSRGGLYSTLYADRFPKDVAALVLVDPSFAGQDEPIPIKDRVAAAASMVKGNALMEDCAASARAHTLSISQPKNCFWILPDASEAEKKFLSYQFLSPSRYESQRSEVESHFPADFNKSLDTIQEERARRSFGTMPLIVLTAENDGENDERYRKWKAGHDALAARSLRGESIVVLGASHFIQIDKPEAVISAITKVTLAVNKRQ